MKVSEKKIRELSHEKDRLFREVNKTRELEVEVEFFLTRKLELEKRKRLRETPQPEETSRYRQGKPRRSLSTSELENSAVFKEPGSATKHVTRRTRRIHNFNDENLDVSVPMDSIIDSSPVNTPGYRTRSRRQNKD